MPSKAPKFKRTEQAAKSDRLTKWDLIAAIAEDADEAGIPITGAESVIAAKAALEAAGSDYADNTVKHLCCVAKFDFESTNEQRKIWRRYGWSNVARVARAGWSQNAAAALLGGERRTQSEIAAAIAETSSRGIDTPSRSFDDRCADWVRQANRLLMDGSKLVDEADTVSDIRGHAQFVVMLMQRFSESHIDAELRQMLDSADVK